jgi:hypothetical protein
MAVVTALGTGFTCLCTFAGLAVVELSAASSCQGAVADPAPSPEPAAVTERMWRPSWLGIRLVGEVGAGQVTMAPVPSLGEGGDRESALAVAYGFEGEGWVRPQIGVGLRVASGFYAPFSASLLANSYALIEPQVLWRTAPSSFGPRQFIVLSWRASAGLGLSSVHTDEACGKHCDEVFARADRLSGSASTGGLLSIGPVGLYGGLRFAFDTSVDWSTSLNFGLGLEL